MAENEAFWQNPNKHETLRPSKTLVFNSGDKAHDRVSQGVGQITQGSSTHLCTEAVGETPSILPGGSPPFRA